MSFILSELSDLGPVLLHHLVLFGQRVRRIHWNE